ncbi:SAM-dependent methyltransferase, putative [Geotalea daltonii FRC-32]|uniref:SAM-dependent methyltransferase, putative n=1 Tax=Geotalea daltonii (strain DSM 22248 / JCM 15807 / FRC-32) TaxID=316067 RepID=B9M8P9_GEODF|nr:class I SAM-dependent methyltransferase [Geotalea daltonii]ACM20395.1 SAM-dependent methyltransferase, putative [Geotalea daltonii FRC-32]
MATVAEHYEYLLADYYSWMFGDFAGKVETHHRFFSVNQIQPTKSGLAMDLGAGPGFQSIPLAQLGFRVLAVDLSLRLLEELHCRCGNLPITPIHGDLMDFAAWGEAPIELCVCMGDTLPHLPDFESVTLLLEQVYRSLEPGGRLVLSFRDLSLELHGTDRFIPVRSDADTVFTCFLEYESHYVTVHDLLYTLKEAWELRKSTYRKIRISPAWIVEQLEKAGFLMEMAENMNGMITVIARKPVVSR